MLSDEDKAIENAKWGLGIAAVIGLHHSLGIMFGSLYFPLFRWFIHGKKDLQKVDSSIVQAFVHIYASNCLKRMENILFIFTHQ